jgi:hypothetical protein
MVKHLVVKPKTTFQRFAKRTDLKVFGKRRVHMCDGSLRGAAFRHVPTPMHLSGTAVSGNHRLIRYACEICGIKRTFGQSG